MNTTPSNTPRTDADRFAHVLGSPWWYVSTLDGGVHFGICEYRTGLYRIYSAASIEDLQTGDGHLECTETSLHAAREEVLRRCAALEIAE